MMPNAMVFGIDLRSGARYPTGVASMDTNRRCHALAVVRTDDEILSAVEACAPRVIAIDAPLALPEGRCCASKECACARFGIMREVDRVCAAAGYRPFPALLPSMVGMTLRGIALRETLESRGYEVIEVYPGMSQDVMGIPRKGGRGNRGPNGKAGSGIDGLRRGLKRHGVLGLPRRRIAHDELDAVTCALTAVLYLEGQTETMGPGLPVPLVLPERSIDWATPSLRAGERTR